MKWIFSVLALGLVAQVQASTIAVIDSGLDYKHDMIRSNLWTNANEVDDHRDNDGNGYQDDIYGWNFAEKSNQIIDYKYLGTFTPDCKKFFDIQGRMFLGTASESDIAWLKEKRGDKAFIAELGKFGNFVHGTHVAGIAVRDSKSVAMGIKLIPTEVKPFFEGLANNKNLSFDRWTLLEMGFGKLAEEQMKLMTEIGVFIDFHKMAIANGSFGTGYNQAKMIGDGAFKLLFFRAPTEAESERAALLFINSLIKKGGKFVQSAPNTLFVFAAGNDGLSNDKYGTSPANIKADNVITVAATYKNEFIAPFSNYGVKNVEIAAPGMLIRSAIPGNDYLEVSGTSQAAPYVANIAAKIKAANPSLRPVHIKTILMSTVDKKAFLADKVMAGGIINAERAVVAAELTKSLSLSESIARAGVQVRDVETVKTTVNLKAVRPVPLSPMFR